MEKQEEQERIRRGREFMMSQCGSPEEQSYVSDQEKKLPQPPLVKAPMTDSSIELPLEFDGLLAEDSFRAVVLNRKSSRVYTEEEMSLSELSFLLYYTQGVKEIRGRSYATLRTVPCGGARHPFETYLLVQKVAGLTPGAYHYLPMTHRLELLEELEQNALRERIEDSLFGQSWAEKANVVFYWSFVPYRAEWRYGPFAHKINLIDLGHVGENLYLGCAALGLGTCGIGYYNQALCDKTFRLDGEEEFIAYTQSVGTVQEKDAPAEQEFYRFVKEQGL